jgi:hypothetical protein
MPRGAGTYLSRLHSLGLVEFGPAADELNDQYDALSNDEAVREARASIERAKLGSPRVTRKTVSLSGLGWEFWSACAPDAASRS